ncbi:hypothetical protein [Companilactobacillus sp.]|nr:hypothetical protein [Companilactobacillus sp.]MCH4008127.1 hypothetical protein [Companilactobacillus sp.]MCH4051694.1 hypothetical protein [Companilactobacillus sp.]MCH4076070.1 hypothetical protein [Companilactobacillus sp.]MCH4124645.1 hypothetical protein [Companilactobacillus sp.]MCH4132392.1 hypothetical protein [Companilactobacillus sp.]
MNNKSVLKDLLKIKQLVSDQNLMTGLYDQQLKSLDTAIDKVTPVKMPRLFDDWVKITNDAQNKEYLIQALIGEVHDFYVDDDKEVLCLTRWIGEDRDNRVIQCVRAILDGYEVEE